MNPRSGANVEGARVNLPRPAALDAAARSCEWVFSHAAPAPWDTPAGAVLRSAGGSLALNIAPRRWLALGAPETWREAALAAGAVEFDTCGRWRVYEFARDSAALRAALDAPAALARRDCLAMTWFDTPAIIATHAAPDLFLVCVPASYADSFLQQALSIEDR